MDLKNRIKMMARTIDAAQVTAQQASVTDEQALEFKDFYPEWEIGKAYKQDEIFTYNGDLYRVSQNHTSQEQWIPGATGTESLYYKISIDPETGYEEWKQPSGAHDAYSQGDIVKHNGKLWVSTVVGEKTNTWEPGVYGWDEYSEDSSEDVDTDPEPVDPTPDPIEPEPEPAAYPEWVQPTGAHDAYSVGDIVSHNGSTWISIADANVWGPGVYGWEKYTGA